MEEASDESFASLKTEISIKTENDYDSESEIESSYCAMKAELNVPDQFPIQQPKLSQFSMSSLSEACNKKQITSLPQVKCRKTSKPLANISRCSKIQLPKPRLGVKIPSRHLTSQIVSPQDIVQEILKRSKQRRQLPS